jgi:DNA-binding MarR family transcriptional regulator
MSTAFAMNRNYYEQPLTNQMVRRALIISSEGKVMKMSRPASRAPGPPPGIMEEIRKRLTEREVQGMQTLFALRAGAQQMDNALNEWLADTAGSFARFQILMALWTRKQHEVPHGEIVSAMGVTRATISGLMASLERDGLVKSHSDQDDRRKLIARLTAKGETTARRAFETSLGRFRLVFASLSATELTRLTALLHRIREGFAAQSE